MNKVIEQFYDPTQLEVAMPIIEGREGRSYLSSVSLSTAGVVHELSPQLIDTLRDKTTQLYDSIECVRTKIDGVEYDFEIGQLPGTNSADTEVRVSTYSSSLTTNDGNGFEIADWSRVRPERTFVYVASPGNGLSSSLTSLERSYFRRQGSFLYEYGNETKGLPIVRALQLALKETGVEASRLGSDSAGAVMASALGATAAYNTISAMHQNVRPNVFDRSFVRLVRGLAIDERKASKAFADQTPDKLAMSDYWTDLVAVAKSNSYNSRAANFEDNRSPSMLYANAIGLGKGPEAGDPLLKDLAACILNQPEINVLLTHGAHDPLVAGDHLEARLLKLTASLSHLSRGVVRAAVIEPASHGPHTFYPQLIHELQHQAIG